ncbi:MAG TPA: aldolase/citrate lyase family protein [Chthonomonadales bacterium]|nr:aldolase/citrate lyase family protein [Chthonomonadales bacterium]
MKTNPVRAALAHGDAQIGAWLSLASPMAARFMARMGFAWLTVDVEHSPVNWETAAEMFGAIADAGCVPLARVPANNLENAKRALDAGAYGVVFPMCCCPEEAAQAVAACRYPPVGRRSVGGGLHSLNFETSTGEYYRNANHEILVIVQAEHVQAVENCDRIFSVPGIDAMFVGPNDLLASMNKTPAMETDDPEFVRALDRLRQSAVAHGVAPGIHVADSAAAVRRAREGWKFIAVSSELGFMMQAARAAAAEATGAGSRHEVARY